MASPRRIALSSGPCFGYNPAIPIELTSRVQPTSGDFVDASVDGELVFMNVLVEELREVGLVELPGEASDAEPAAPVTGDRFLGRPRRGSTRTRRISPRIGRRRDRRRT